MLHAYNDLKWAWLGEDHKCNLNCEPSGLCWFYWMPPVWYKWILWYCILLIKNFDWFILILEWHNQWYFIGSGIHEWYRSWRGCCTDLLCSRYDQGNLKVEPAMVAMLLSHMEASYCTSGLFSCLSPSSNFIKLVLPFLHRLKWHMHLGYCAVSHGNDNLHRSRTMIKPYPEVQ